MTLIWLCCAFLIGIVVGDTLGGLAVPLVVAGCGAAALAWVWRDAPARLPLMMLAAVSFGAARDAHTRPVEDDTAIWTYAGRTVELTGIVEGHPDTRDDRQIVVVAAEKLDHYGMERVVRGRVRVALEPTPALRYGDRVALVGRLLRPNRGVAFDFRAYLERHGIFAVMEQPGVQVLERDAGTFSIGRLFDLQTALRATTLRLLHEPHAALVAGMLLGTHGAIPKDVLADFRATGTSHVLVISGWNFGILVGGVVGVLEALGLHRRRAMALSLPVLVVYALFVGASPSVVRAGIMGGLVVWAELADRESDGWTGLLLACALMALLDPNVPWDTGFQLSALATAGIIALHKPIRRALTSRGPLSHRRLAWVVETLSATLAALLFALPILLYSFGTLAWIAPLANIVIAPAVPLAMLFGGLASVLGLMFLPLGQLAALLAWPFTTWMLLATRFLAGLPGATTSVPRFGVGWLVCWYGGLLLITIWRPRREAAAPVLVDTGGT